MKKHVMLILLMLPASAMAHPGHDVTGFVAGFVHPFSGFDHILAILAVGIWSAMGSRGVLRMAGVFLAGMALGGVLGMQGVVVPMLESLVLGSALLSALLVALAVRMPISAQMAVIAMFALLHGMAHGMELPATVAASLYGSGFLLATALLLFVGWVCAKFLGVQRNQRLLGAALAVLAGSLFLV